MSENSRRQFDIRLVELFDKKDQSSSHLTGDKYKWIINRLIALSVGDVKKVTKDYRLVKMYELIAIPYGDKTVQRLQKPGTNLLYVSHDDMFDAIREVHLSTGHGARDVMHDRAKQQYVNLTKEVLQLYSDLCEECQAKKSCKARRIFVDTKPIVSNILNFRCQVDIVDMQDRPDGHHLFIMTYQDYNTKLVTLKPLRTNHAQEVASHLVDIFCTFGCPLILQSNYGRKYSRKIVKEINGLWPDCVLVHGKMNVDDTGGGGCTGAGREMEMYLTSWMKENNTTRWSQGLRFIQWQLNNRKHVHTNKTPFTAMFSENSRCGLKSTNLPTETIAVLQSEEDLEEVLNTTSVSLATPSVPFDKSDSSHNMLKHGIARAAPPNLLRVDPASLIPRAGTTMASENNSGSGSYMSMLKRLSPSGAVSVDSNIGSSAPPNIMDLKAQIGSNMAAGTPAAEDLLSLSGAGSAIHFETICSVCEFAYVGSQKCSVCKNFCHEKPPCSQILNLGSDSSSTEIICLLCERSKHDQRSSDYCSIKQQQSEKEQRANDYYNMKQQQSDKAFTPNPKRYKNSPERNIVMGSRSLVPGVDPIRGGVGMAVGVGLHTIGERSVSPSFPLTDPKPTQPCKPFAYKSRVRPPLFKHNTAGEGFAEWCQ